MNKRVGNKGTLLLLCGSVLSGCGGSSGDQDAGTASNDGTLSCQLDAFHQCAEWVHLSATLVSSLAQTCVDDDGGVVVDSCPTADRIGTCEQLDDPPTPDLLNHFYLSPTASDPVAYTAAKEQACIDAGGTWVLAP